MTKLSVNINKIATLRNARGGNNPDLIAVARDCERFGADGITVHPRPDERHIRYSDVLELQKHTRIEFNIEGYPSERFLDLVLQVKPHQVTLVPDPPDAITSNAGWDTLENKEFLIPIITRLKDAKIRTSLFIDPLETMVKGAAAIGTDRIELYTERYAHFFIQDKYNAIKPYKVASEMAKKLGIQINAGHDLNLQNLHFLVTEIPFIQEVSIGHALICDALYLGLENTIALYLNQLQK